MNLKLTNNAATTLAAAISASDSSITLTSGGGALFPALAAGEYFFATLVNASNSLEVVKVTGRAGDVLAVVRGQDNTTARAYTAGDKVELRLVAAVFSEMIQRDGSVAMTANLNHGGFKAINVADPIAAQDAATKNYVDTTAVAAVNAEAAARAAADTALINSTNSAIASEAAARAAADATKVSKAGDTMTGNLTVQNTSPTIVLQDTDNGVTKQLHHNADLIGFLSNDSNWLMYGNNGGQIWSRNYGWLHDFFFSQVANCGGVSGSGYAGTGIAGGYTLYDDGYRVRLNGTVTMTACNCACCGCC
jgi:hypothetical protein